MANYLKPQSPLQHKDGDYFYPLTTIDQIIVDDTTRLNAELINVDLSDAVDNGSEMTITNAETLEGKTIEEIKQQIYNDMINFSVVGGTTEPANPIENMIWVQTDSPISKIIFNYLKPNLPVEGMVWIKTDDLSHASVTPLKIDEKIQLSPMGLFSAQQYVNGSWVEIEAKIYQGGQWQTWGVYIVKDGEITNMGFGAPLRTGSEFTLADKGSYLHISTTTNTTSGYATPNPINVKGYSQLILECNIISLGANTGIYIGTGVGLTTTINEPDYADLITFLFARKMATATGIQVLKIDIPEGTELCYPCVFCDCGNLTSGFPELYVYNMYLK